MYQIIYTKKYNKALLKSFRGGLKKSAQVQIVETIDLLASGKKIPSSYRDHQLHGIFSEYRECHIQGDLLIVYHRVEKELVLVLINIGSHNDLF